MVPIARNVGIQVQAFYRADGLVGDVTLSHVYGLSGGVVTFLR